MDFLLFSLIHFIASVSKVVVNYCFQHQLIWGSESVSNSGFAPSPTCLVSLVHAMQPSFECHCRSEYCSWPCPVNITALQPPSLNPLGCRLVECRNNAHLKMFDDQRLTLMIKFVVQVTIELTCYRTITEPPCFIYAQYEEIMFEIGLPHEVRWSVNNTWPAIILRVLHWYR